MTEVINNASQDDILPGDYVIWEYEQEDEDTYVKMRRQGYAHHQDDLLNWFTKEGIPLTPSDHPDATIYIRRNQG